MTTFLQTLLNAVAVGSLYGLIALGYTMVYGILQFINFAHSDIVMLGAWISYVVARSAGWVGKIGPDGQPVSPGILAAFFVLVAAMAICGALGFTIERLAYRPLRRAPRLNVLITAIGVSLFLENTGQLPGVFGAKPQAMPPLIPDSILFTVAEVPLRLVDTIVIVTALGLMGALQWLVYGTKLGRALRAVAYDTRTASLMGINVDAVISFTFVIGSALAAAAGLLFSMKYSGLKQPADSTWVLLGLKAFVAAVIGGIGNLRGAMLGGLLIGFIEFFGAAYFSPHLKDIYVFTLLIVVLLVKPTGLLGKPVVEKV